MRFIFPQFQAQVTNISRLLSSVCGGRQRTIFVAGFSTAITLATLILMTEPAHGNPNEAARLTDMRLRAVLEAKSTQELKEASERSERIKIGRIECEIQLKGRRVPSHCFEVLKDEFESGLIVTESKKSQEDWLTQLCKKRAQSSNDLRELNRLASLSFMPHSCLDQVIARALDLKYASESEDPSGLFTDRFPQPSRVKLPVRPKSGPSAQKLQALKLNQVSDGVNQIASDP